MLRVVWPGNIWRQTEKMNCAARTVLQWNETRFKDVDAWEFFTFILYHILALSFNPIGIRNLWSKPLERRSPLPLEGGLCAPDEVIISSLATVEPF